MKIKDICLNILRKLKKGKIKMPWTTKDTDRFKKGLSEEQKKKWVTTANGVLADCKEKGGEDCEGKAIRIANGTVTNNSEYEVIKVNFTQLAYTVDIRIFEGKTYYVVPVVMMVEGVHNGSRGPILHTAEELGKIELSWNGIPVTIGHPFTDEGNYVSANSPETLTKWSVGRVFNAKMDNEKLKADVWLEEERLKIVSPETLQMIRNGQIVEVSIGVFSEDDYIDGKWNDEEYIAVARNYRPDHLALLPGEVGACSINDGCGLRVNSDSGTITNAETVCNDTLDTTQLDTQLKDNNEKVINMCTPCKEKVNELIAHESTHFTEDDREWLETLTEDKLDKFIPKLVQVNKPTVEDAWEIIKGVTPDEYIAHIPEEVKVQVNNAFKEKEERQTIITNILTNSKVWKEEDLVSLSVNMLKKLEVTTKPVITDYSVMGTRGKPTDDTVTPLTLS